MPFKSLFCNIDNRVLTMSPSKLILWSSTYLRIEDQAAVLTKKIGEKNIGYFEYRTVQLSRSNNVQKSINKM